MIDTWDNDDPMIIPRATRPTHSAPNRRTDGWWVVHHTASPMLMPVATGAPRRNPNWAAHIVSP